MSFDKVRSGRALCLDQERRQQLFHIQAGLQLVSLHVMSQDSKSAFSVWEPHADYAVETARPLQRWVDGIGAVGRGQNEDPLPDLKAIQQREQLGDQGLLVL